MTDRIPQKDQSRITSSPTSSTVEYQPSVSSPAPSEAPSGTPVLKLHHPETGCAGEDADSCETTDAASSSGSDTGSVIGPISGAVTHSVTGAVPDAVTGKPPEQVQATPSAEDESLSLCAGIVDRLLRAAHRLRGLLSDHFGEFELSDVRFSVLRILHDAEPDGCTQSELARRLDQSESSISTLVKRMRNSGLLYRLRSTVDRRKWALKLSDNGRKHLTGAQFCHAQRMTELLSGFDVSEQRQLAGLLNKLIDELATETLAGGGEGNVSSPARDSARHYEAACVADNAPETCRANVPPPHSPAA